MLPSMVNQKVVVVGFFWGVDGGNKDLDHGAGEGVSPPTSAVSESRKM